RIARRRCFRWALRFLNGTPLYFHTCNAWAIHINNGEGVALLNNRLTALRNMFQTCEQESCYCMVMDRLFQRQGIALAQLPQRRTALGHHRSIWEYSHQDIGFGFPLVTDVADELFQEIFCGHQTSHAAVLIDNDRHMQTPLLQHAEEPADLEHLWHIEWRAGW